MAKTKQQKSLDRWTDQKWRTPSGKPSSETGEVYAPSKTISQLKSTEKGRKKLQRANQKKKEATSKGRQYANHGLHENKNRKDGGIVHINSVYRDFSSGGKIDKDSIKCNSPRRTPSHKTKSHVVKACKNGKEKILRFGQQGVKGAGKNPKTAKDKARRKSYYARHDAQDSNPDIFSARYWSHKVKWKNGGKWMQDLDIKKGALNEAAERAGKSKSEYCANPPSALAKKRCTLWKTFNKTKKS